MVSKPVLIKLFETINFLVLVGFFFYVFKKYFLDSVKDEMSEEKKQRKLLIEEDIYVQKAVKELKGTIVGDELVCKDLQKKVDQWHEHVVQEEDERRQKKEERIAYMYDTLNNRLSYARDQRQARLILPEVFNDGYDRLYRSTSSQEKKRFVESILSYIKREGA